ncbi:MAG: Glu/Leu/Phe/Val dehydrogenase dimerization domain-containing protein, partial [Thermodesulfobacteriota bacterium]
LAAGGLRVQADLTREHLIAMAANMTRKMRVASLRVDGAKAGIARDPAAPGKAAALARFLSAIRPYIEQRYSVGPDLNLRMEELEAAGRGLGLASVKMAIARAQGITIPELVTRMQLLEAVLPGGQTLGWLRGGYGVGAAVLAVLPWLGLAPREARVAVQGFGAVARSALAVLAAAQVRVTAIADASHALVATGETGLPVPALLALPGNGLPPAGPGMRAAVREAILETPCDCLVPAAVEHAIDDDAWPRLAARAVVPGANLAVTAAAAAGLASRGVLVLPDFLTGCGGSLSMEGLFGPAARPEPQAVLDHVCRRMTALVERVLTESRQEGRPPTQVALDWCRQPVAPAGGPPYGPLPAG